MTEMVVKNCVVQKILKPGMLQVLSHGGSRDSTACYPRSTIADVENEQASLIGIWGTKIGQMTRQQLRPATEATPPIRSSYSSP